MIYSRTPTGLRLRQPGQNRGQSFWRYPAYSYPLRDQRPRRTPAPRGQESSSYKSRFRRLLEEQKFLMFFLISATCFAGVTWQLYEISYNYLTYPVVSEVYVFKREAVVPPAFSLCFPWIEMLPWHTLNQTQESWISMGDEERKRRSIQISKQFTVKMIFDQTYNMSDIKIAGFVRKVDSFETDIRPGRMLVEKFVKDDLICYKMMNADALKSKFFYLSHQITYGMEPGMTMGVTLRKSMLKHISKVVIFLNPRSEFPRGDGDFPINYLSNNNHGNNRTGNTMTHSTGIFGNASMIGITYAKTTLKRLEPPFNTMCFPYNLKTVNGKKYESHYEWIHECVNNLTLIKMKEGSFTSTFLRQDPNNFTILSQYRVFSTNESIGLDLDLIINYCNKSSPGIQCQAELFMPQLISSRDSKEISFILYDMSGPETQLFFHPLTSMMDLYVQVISVIGAWLGISCVDIVFNILKLVGNSIRSCKKMI